MMLLSPLFTIVASSTPTALPSSTWSSVINAVTNYFTPTAIVETITAVVSAGIVFVFLWWGVRKAFRSIMGAVKNGSLSINAGRRRRR